MIEKNIWSRFKTRVRFRDYLRFAEMEFKSIRETREPMMFPLSKLILSIAQDEHTRKETLKLVKPLLEQVRPVFTNCRGQFFKPRKKL
jgi:hypothetical protein